jgi:hypothetical protein
VRTRPRQPADMQIVSRPLAEAVVLRVAGAFEAATRTG